MQAAHDAGGIPLVIGNVLHGLVGIGNAGVEEYVQVDSGTRDDPEEIPTQRPEARKRIISAAKAQIEDIFSTSKEDAQHAFKEGHQ